MTTQRMSGEQRRTQILEAAMALFAAQGFESTSTREIAERAHINESLIFRHFATKLELFHAALREFSFQKQLAFSPERLLLMPLPEMLAALLTRSLDTFWTHRAAMRLMIAEAGRDPVAARDLLQTQQRPRQRLQMLLEACEAQGTLRQGEARAAASVLIAAASGFLNRSLRDEPDDWETARTEFIQDLVRLILPGLTPQTAAAFD